MGATIADSINLVNPHMGDVSGNFQPVIRETRGLAKAYYV
jgi:hypothetical protein